MPSKARRFSVQCTIAPVVIQPSSLPRSTPEAQGVPSQAIQEFVNAADATIRDMNSVMLVRHGHVIAEGWWSPYAPQHKHMFFSLSKSFTSSAIGMLVDDGKLSVDDFVLDLMPDEAPNAPSDNLKAMRLRHLLSMSTGHAADTLGPMVTGGSGSWVRVVLSQPVTHTPGTHFVYNSGATHVLAAIVQRITGQRLSQFLQPRLYEPLGIEAAWQTDPNGIDMGGWGMSATTESIAKFGQLYLQKGVWQGQRILSEAWVAEATSKHIDNAKPDDPLQPNDWAQGYGYQFWRCQPAGMYRGDGAFGQYCVVMPDQDAVLAITSGVQNMQAVLDLAWKHVLPALNATPTSAFAAATNLTSKLSIPTPQGHRTSPTAQRVSGRVFMLEPNDQEITSLAFEFTDDACVMIRHDGRGEQRIGCGYGDWLPSVAQFDDRGPSPTAASGAWTSDDTFTMKLVFVETPFIETYACRFGQDTLVIDHSLNVSFGPTTLPTLIGHLA